MGPRLEYRIRGATGALLVPHEGLEGIVEDLAGDEVVGELHGVQDSLGDDHAADAVDKTSASVTAQQT